MLYPFKTKTIVFSGVTNRFTQANDFHLTSKTKFGKLAGDTRQGSCQEKESSWLKLNAQQCQRLQCPKTTGLYLQSTTIKTWDLHLVSRPNFAWLQIVLWGKLRMTKNLNNSEISKPLTTLLPLIKLEMEGNPSSDFSSCWILFPGLTLWMSQPASLLEYGVSVVVV